MSGFPMPPPASSGGAGAAPRKIEKEEAKEIIAEMEAIVDDPANKATIEGLKAQLKIVGTDLMMFMTLVLPGVVQLSSPVLTKYNLPADPFGLIKAFQGMKPLLDDPEVAAAAAKLKEAFMTPEVYEILGGLQAMSGAM